MKQMSDEELNARLGSWLKGSKVKQMSDEEIQVELSSRLKGSKNVKRVLIKLLESVDEEKREFVLSYWR
jgi:hypothetical protein